MENKTINTNTDVNTNTYLKDLAAKDQHFIKTNSWQEAHIIRNKDYNLAIVLREPPKIAASLDEILKSKFKSLQFSYDAKEKLELIGAVLDENLNLANKDAFFFYQDIMNLAKSFIELTNAKTIGIRFEKVVHDNCKFFHVDFVPYRLITTYLGSTTHWLKNKNVIRGGLGQQDNSKAVINESDFEILPLYAIGIFKGETNNKNNGIVHRSPKIEPGIQRLVLRMDFIE